MGPASTAFESENSVEKVRVHPLDGPLLELVRAMLSGEGGMPSFPLPRVGGKPHDTLSAAGAALLKSWLRRSAPRLLAKHGGGLIRPWPEQGGLVRQPIWQRASGKTLHLSFGHHAWELLRWLARLDMETTRDGVRVSPQPPAWQADTGQAFLMWRLADSLPPSGGAGAVLSAALPAWVGDHLLLWMAYPRIATPEGARPWTGWLDGGFLTQLEACQGWVAQRWREELGELAMAPKDPELWIGCMEKLCGRATAVLNWSAGSEGRWDLAGPLYRAWCSASTNHVLDTMERLKPELFREGLSHGQAWAGRMKAFASVAEAFARHHQQAASRLFYDEDHAAAQALLHQVSHLPGTDDLGAWAKYVTSRVHAACQP